MRIDREKLTLVMARACMGPEDICQKVKLPRPTFNGAIRGRNLRPVTAGKIAAALGVDVTEILED